MTMILTNYEDKLYVVVFSKVSIFADMSLVPYEEYIGVKTQQQLIDLAQECELKLTKNQRCKADELINGFDELKSGDIITITEEIKKCIFEVID